MRAKKRGNATQQQQDRQERNPLLGTEIEMTPGPRPVPTPPSSGNNSIGGYLSSRSEKRKTSTIATAHPDYEERVSLLDGKGGPSSSPVRRRFRIANTTGRPRGGGGGAGIFSSFNINNWTLSRLMKYLALMLISSSLTFFLLHKESKEVHWTEYENILQPDEMKEKRCFVSNLYAPPPFGGILICVYLLCISLSAFFLNFPKH
jgi:hypothetical protein